MGTLDRWRHGELDRVLWLDIDDYARRVFGGTAWHENPLEWVSAIAQARRIVPTDVVGLDVSAWLAPLLPPGDAGTALDRLSATLTSPTFTGRLADVAAMARHQVSSADLVLLVPPPHMALTAAGGSGEADFDDLDAVCLDLVDLLRGLAESGITSVAVSDADRVNDDEAEPLAPVLSTAAHYGWSRIALGDDGPLSRAVDVIIPVTGSADHVHRVPDSYWHGTGEFPTAGLLVGRVPPDVTPEDVLDRANAIGGPGR